MIKEQKIYPDQWQIPVWILVSEPEVMDNEEKYLGALFKGEDEPSGRLIHVESGRVIKVRRSERQGDHWKTIAKGLTLAGFQEGDRFLSLRYPAVWGKEALLVPQGAMNSVWTGGKAALLGPLVRHGGIPVSVKTLPQDEGKNLLHISASKGALFLTGAVYTLESSDRRLQTSLVMPGPFKEKDISLLGKKVFRFPGLPTVKALYAICLRHRGWALLPPELALSEFEESEGAEGFRVLARTKAFLERKILKLVKNPSGLKAADLDEALGLPEAGALWFLEHLVANGKIQGADGTYRALGNPEEFLSPLARGVLKDLRQRGEAGMKDSFLRTDAQRVELEKLAASGLAIKMEEGWFMDPEAMKKIHSLLLKENGGVWTIAEMRDRLDSSRGCLVAVLTAMEQKKLLERHGPEYRVVE